MILLTGASGLLGRQLKIEADRPTHEEFNIEKIYFNPKPYDLIINCAAYTKVEKAETNRQSCFDVNVRGLLNLMEMYPTTPIVQISSEYAHNPVNFYSLTKSMAEQLVTYHSAPYLIVRTLFKPTPWPHEYAFKDQFTLGSYVDIIAPLIEKAIMEWDKKSKLIYIGHGGRKTMYELAIETRPSVQPNSIQDMKVKLPSDYR